MRILLTGITGYVGGALVPRLQRDGHELVGLARNPAAAVACPPTSRSSRATCSPARAWTRRSRAPTSPTTSSTPWSGRRTASFAAREEEGARQFAEAAARSGVAARRLPRRHPARRPDLAAHGRRG